MKATKVVKNFSEIYEREYEMHFVELLRFVGGGAWNITVKRARENDTGKVDFRVTLGHPSVDEAVEFLVETKPLPRPSQLRFREFGERYLEKNPGRIVVPVLAAPFISDRIADLCEKHGWSWFDLSGNCRIKVADVIYIERTGAKAVYKQPRPLANLSTAASARVLRALLAPQNAGRIWTQTKLKRHCEDHNCGVSFGLINKVIGHLRDQAYVEDRDDGFIVSDPVELLESWGKAYRFDRYRRVNCFTLLKSRVLEDRLEGLNGSICRAAFAVFSAADHQAPSVRQNKAWFFVNEGGLDEFIHAVEAKRVDTGENLVVFVPDDDGVFYLGDVGTGRGLPCTNPVQTWLDLISVGGRGEEAAEALMGQCLKPRWKGLSDA